jgi:hypothetical protein
MKPRQTRFTAIPSRSLRFWWEAVEVVDDPFQVVRSLGSYRSERAALDSLK